MIQNLAQIASSATQLATGRGDYTLSEVSYWANIAVQELAQRYGHNPIEALAVSSTTSGENRYAVPQDFDSPIALTIYQGSGITSAVSSRATIAIPLRGHEAQWADSRDLPDSGVPQNYVFYTNYFELYPSPNSAYSMQLRYNAKHPTLLASTDTVRLDDRWHPAVVFKCAEYLVAARNDPVGEAVARDRYLNYVSQIPTDQQKVQRDKGSMSMRFTGFKHFKDH